MGSLGGGWEIRVSVFMDGIYTITKGASNGVNHSTVDRLLPGTLIVISDVRVLGRALAMPFLIQLAPC